VSKVPTIAAITASHKQPNPENPLIL